MAFLFLSLSLTHSAFCARQPQWIFFSLALKRNAYIYKRIIYRYAHLLSNTLLLSIFIIDIYLHRNSFTRGRHINIRYAVPQITHNIGISFVCAREKAVHRPNEMIDEH